MLRLLAIAAALCGMVAAAQAQTNGSSFTTPASGTCNTGFTRSTTVNTNDTVVGSGASWISCRADTSHISGKWAIRFKILAVASQNGMSGFENASGAINGHLGSDNNGAGCQSAVVLYHGGVNIGECATGGIDIPVNGIFEIAIDLDAANVTIWAQKVGDTNWNNTVGATPGGAGGKTLNAALKSVAIFPTVSAQASNTIQMITTGWTAPAGFQVWDAAAASGCSGGLLLRGVGC